MARHEHAHEVLRLAVGVVAGDHDLVDLARIEVADRALDEAAFLVDELRRGRAERQLAHVLPEPQQIFEVALDLALGAVGAGGAQDDAHALRHFELGGDRLQALAVERRGDLARDAAAARRVRHQHRIAAGEREIGGERRALVAALLLDDLHQQHLPALDHFLDLVLARARLPPLRQLLERVLGADALDLVFLVLVVVVDRRSCACSRRSASLRRCSARLAGVAARRRRQPSARTSARHRLRQRLAAICAASPLGLGRLADRLGRGDIRGHRLGEPSARRSLLGRRLLDRRHRLDRGGALRASSRGRFLRLARFVGVALVLRFVALGLLGVVARLLLQQRLPVGEGDLIVVGMDFGEGEEAVAVAAVIDERRLQRRLDPRYLGEIDVSSSCWRSAASKSNSSTRLPRSTTTRVSSGWVASMSILFDMEN